MGLLSDLQVGQPVLLDAPSGPARPRPRSALMPTTRRGRLRTSVERAARRIQAANTGVVLSLIATPPAERDSELSAITREIVLSAVITVGVSCAAVATDVSVGACRPARGARAWFPVGACAGIDTGHAARAWLRPPAGLEAGRIRRGCDVVPVRVGNSPSLPESRAPFTPSHRG
jgi:hypothetical protein